MQFKRISSGGLPRNSMADNITYINASNDASGLSERADNHAESKERQEAIRGFQSLSDHVKEQRQKQRGTGKSGITGCGDSSGRFASATDILGDFAGRNATAARAESFQVSLSVKAELLKTGDQTRSSSDSKREAADSSERLTQLNEATKTLLAGAGDRFGKEAIADLNIKKDDVGAATAALLFGPAVCKAMGAEQTSLIGKQMVVFGIAPMYGAANEAKKQFDQENLQKTVHAAGGNFITGTAIGAILERAHPAILAAALTGGVAAITNEQLNSPEHRARNAELCKINGKLATCSNAELLQFAERTMSVLGPQYYKAAFDLASGGAGLPEGSAIAAGVREESRGLAKKIDFGAVAEHLQNIGGKCRQALSDFIVGPKNKFRYALAEGQGLMHGAGSAAETAEDYILRMTGKPHADASIRAAQDAARTRAVQALSPHIDGICNGLAQLAKNPAPEEKQQLMTELNQRFMKLEKHRIGDKNQAIQLAKLEDEFAAHVKDLQKDVAVGKAEAEALDARAPETLTAAETERLEQYHAKEDSLYTIITDKLKGKYGWDGKSAGMPDRTSVYSRQLGMNAQQEANDLISGLLNEGLDKNPVLLEVFKKNGIPAERARDWVGIPLSGNADQAGCDYLLVNKNTGEAFSFDMTLQVLSATMKHGRLADSPLTNKKLEFLVDKSPPADRLDTVIGLADNDTKREIRSTLPAELSSAERQKHLEQMQKAQLAQIIAETISRPSKLNIADSNIPSASAGSDFSRMAYEIWRFRTSLENIGYTKWAERLISAINYAKNEHAKTKSFLRIPYY